MAAPVSKNAREGRRQVHRKPTCAKGHELVRVLRVPIAGRAQRLWLCECDGYRPINASTPYLSIKAPEAVGKAALPRNKGGCTPQVSA